MVSIFQKRKWTLLSIIIIVPVGLYTKFYSGPLADWVHSSLGGILYVIFWSLFIFLFLPATNPFRIAIIVFLATCLIEFLQLWHPEFLETIRGYFIGRTILGNSFSWWDMLHYWLGSLCHIVENYKESGKSLSNGLLLQNHTYILISKKVLINK